MRESLHPLFNLLPPGLFQFSLDRVNRAAGRPRLRRGQALWCLVFCSSPRLFHRDQILTPITQTWYHQDNFIVTSKYSSTYQDWQKTRHRDADANSPNRRAIIC